VSGYRVLYREVMLEGEWVFLCDFAEHRNVVYEIFQQMLLEKLSEE
jgi:hypothetical protein